MDFSALFTNIRGADTPSIVFMVLALSVLMIPNQKIAKQVKNRLLAGFFILALLSMVGSFTIRVVEIINLTNTV